MGMALITDEGDQPHISLLSFGFRATAPVDLHHYSLIALNHKKAGQHLNVLI